MEVNFPTDHILYRPRQFYSQTAIQLPHFIHILNNYGQKSVHIFSELQDFQLWPELGRCHLRCVRFVQKAQYIDNK